MDSYKLPGTRFVQRNPYSNDGNCFGTAIGRALSRVELVFGSKTRCFGVKVKDLLKEQVSQDATQAAMARVPGAWQKGELIGKDATEYSTLHLDGKKWGTAFDLHLLALYLSKKRPNVRIVVHTMNTNMYMAYFPLNEGGTTVNTICPVSELHPEQIDADDLIVVNNNNVHWSYAEYFENENVAPMFEDATSTGDSIGEVVVID
jgi:hypothetical protein